MYLKKTINVYYALYWIGMQFFIHLPPREKRMTRATGITLFRILCIPFILFFIKKADWNHAMVLFGIASITDFLDGNIARWCNEKTILGALLDPVADKMLVLCTAVSLFWHQNIPFLIPSWFLGALLLKEAGIIIGSLYLFYLRQVKKIRPTFFGKLATVMQLGVLWSVLFSYTFKIDLQSLYSFFVLGTFFTIGALLQYAYTGYCVLKECHE